MRAFVLAGVACHRPALRSHAPRRYVRGRCSTESGCSPSPPTRRVGRRRSAAGTSQLAWRGADGAGRSSRRSHAAQGRTTYGCGNSPGKPGVQRDGDRRGPFEELVVAELLTAVETPELLASVREASSAPDADALAEAVKAAQRKLLEYADDYDSGVISRAEWLRLRKRAEDRREAACREMSKARRSRGPRRVRGVGRSARRLVRSGVPAGAASRDRRHRDRPRDPGAGAAVTQPVRPSRVTIEWAV